MPTTTASPGAERAPYRPHGAALALLHSHAPQVLLSGPAGSGKTLANLMKLHLCCEHVPGLRCLIVRKTRASLSQSVLVTYERDVLPPGHPAMKGAQRTNRSAYRYPNGSEIALGGMDVATRVMSAEYDLVYVPEAIELTEDDWESLDIRARNGRLTYQQVMADTNPDRPTHWLKQRCDAGKTLLLESRHEDNPRYWDRAAGRWTPEGAAYIARLDALTGPRKLRYRFGRWVRAEGVVYEDWDPLVHLIDPFEIPADWPRVWSVDFGYRNPFTWQAWALDGDGRLYLYRQIYLTNVIVADHAARILELTVGEPPPVAVICDHDAEDRATLERALGVPTLAAPKAVQPGIQAVQQRLRRAGDGLPRLFVLRDSLDRRDPLLEEAKKPCCLEEEVDGYVWNNKLAKDAPVKDDDHGCDAMRYTVLALAGPGGGDDGRRTVYRA